MKKSLVLGVLIVIALFSVMPVAFAISQKDAEQIAFEYKYDDESLKIYGPYAYELNSYYMANFYKTGEEDFSEGVVIINEKSGEILKDQETIKKILLTHFIVKNNDVSRRNHANLSEIYTRTEKTHRGNMEVIEDAAKLTKIEKQSFEKMIETNKKMADIFFDLNETITKMNAIEKKIEAGNKSYENALEYRRLSDEHISLLEDILEIDEKYKTELAYYYNDLGHTPG